MTNEWKDIMSEPGRFGVSYLMRPSPLLSSPFDIPMRDDEKKPTMVRIEECIQNVGGSEVPTGLRVRTVLDAADLKDCLQRGGYLADKVALMCSFVANQGSPTVLPEIVYQAGRTSKRASLFFVDLPLPQIPRREIDVYAAIDALENMENTLHKDDFDRIHRSLSWYRKAISTTNAPNQVMWSWFGLESLDFVLTKHLNLKRGRYNGIKHQFNKLVVDGDKNFQRSKDLRHKVVHPIEGRMPDSAEIQSICWRMAAVHRTSLSELMDLPIQDSRFFPMLQSEVPIQMVVPGWIHDEQGELDFISRETPRLEFRGFKADIEVGRKKSTKIWSDVNIGYEGPEGTRFKQAGVGLSMLQYGSLMTSDDGDEPRSKE